jgi:O-antigen/teichoic acid export membrane protein
VFARVSAVRDHLAQSLTWSLRRLVILVAPLMVGLMLVADPLTALLHDEQGNSYAAAALPLKLLAAAALLRATSQLLFPVMMASGRPGTAASLSATTLLLLSVGILIAGISFNAQEGIIAVSAAWLGVYPLLLVWGGFYLRRHWNIRIGELAPAFIAPLVGIGAMVSFVMVVHKLTGGNPVIQIGVVLAAVALTYAGLFLNTRRHPGMA